VGCQTGVALVDPWKGTVRWLVRSQLDELKSLTASADGTVGAAVYSTLEQSMIHLWWWPEGRHRRMAVPGFVADAALNEDGTRLAVMLRDAVLVYDLARWKP
jgi:hypothetical protein